MYLCHVTRACWGCCLRKGKWTACKIVEDADPTSGDYCVYFEPGNLPGYVNVDDLKRKVMQCNVMQCNAM